MAEETVAFLGSGKAAAPGSGEVWGICPVRRRPRPRPPRGIRCCPPPEFRGCAGKFDSVCCFSGEGISGREHDAPPEKSNGELESLFHKQGKRRGVAVQKIFLADGTDFAVAEKSGESEWAELLFYQLGVVVWAPEKILAATIAAAEATAVNRRVGELFFCARQQFVHVLGRRHRVAPLELHGLPRARHRTDGQHAGVWVAADEIAHEKSPR